MLKKKKTQISHLCLWWLFKVSISSKSLISPPWDSLPPLAWHLSPNVLHAPVWSQLVNQCEFQPINPVNCCDRFGRLVDSLFFSSCKASRRQLIRGERSQQTGSDKTDEGGGERRQNKYDQDVWERKRISRQTLRRLHSAICRFYTVF